MVEIRPGTRVVPLGQRPDLIETVARWGHGQWGHLSPGSTEEKRAASLRTKHLTPDGVPSTIVVLDADGEAVGTAAILAHDIDGDPRGPWLASVFVAPGRRGEGFGVAAVKGIEASAARAGIGRLYLFTPDKMAFYASLGWTTADSLDYRGEHITVMWKDLG